jgi:hypothetical protein
VRETLSAPPTIFFGDPIGWGWGVMGEIERRVKHIGVDVVQVNVSEHSYNPDRFHRLRDELWWTMRETFERGHLSIPDDPILKGDLNAPHYDDSTGIIKVESKADLKRRGVESPNRADALMMTMRYGPSEVRRRPAPRAKERRSAVTSWRVA